MPPNWTREVKRTHQKIAGVTKANADGVSRQLIIKKLRPGERLTLEREPGNSYDKWAVLVRRAESGEVLGYLPSEPEAINKGIGWCIPKRMDEGIRVEARVKDITGTGAPTRGVNIEMAFWHGPADEQPPGPYFTSSPAVPVAVKKKPAGCLLLAFSACGGVVGLAVLISLLSFVLQAITTP